MIALRRVGRGTANIGRADKRRRVGQRVYPDALEGRLYHLGIRRASRYPRLAGRVPPRQWATFCSNKWPMTIAAYGYGLKDNRGRSTAKGQFSSGCQARVRGTHCPRFRHGQTRRGVPPARDLRPSVSLRAWFRRPRPSAFTNVSHWHSSGQIVTSNLANLRWSTCSAFGQHVPQLRPTARIGVQRRSFQNVRNAVPACAHWPRCRGNFASDASRHRLVPNRLPVKNT